jgi:hypothetical protein
MGELGGPATSRADADPALSSAGWADANAGTMAAKHAAATQDPQALQTDP